MTLCIQPRKRPLLIGAAALAALTAACASTGAVPKPFPMPGSDGKAPAQAPESVTHPNTYSLVGTALSLRGAPYRNGGSDPTGFDCSGFTQYVFAQHGVALPRDTRQQFRMGTTIPVRDMEAGDLLFFSTSDPGASHVAIAVGPDEFIHAPSSAGVVRVERLSVRYWSERFLGVRRVF